MYISILTFFLLMRGANPSLEGIVHVSRPPMLKLPPTIPSVYYLARQETIYYEEGIVSLHLEFRSQENIVIPVVKFKVLYMSFDKFLLAVESHDLSQADKSII